MLFAFFAVGSMWFWFLTVGWLVWLTYLVEAEKEGWSLGIVIGFIALIHLFGDANIFTYVRDNPITIVQLAVLYVALGIAWGSIKYYFYSAKLGRKIEKLKTEFKDSIIKNGGEVDPSNELQRVEFKEFLSNKLDHLERDKINMEGQTGRIIFWMSYWPVSAFWTILNDPIRRFFKMLYRYCVSGIFIKIHRKTIGKSMEL